MSHDTRFPQDKVIKFDRTVINVGGGYIDDSSSTDYGKFIAPLNGTYQFNANFYSVGQLGADLRKNGNFITGANNGGSGPASLNAILDLEEGDEMHCERPGWVNDDAVYGRYFTSYSGVLIRAHF